MRMKFPLIGATGALGKQVLERGLNQGHEITALVRDPAAQQRSNAGCSPITRIEWFRGHRFPLVAGGQVVALTQAPANTRGANHRVSLWNTKIRNRRGDSGASGMGARQNSLEDPEHRAPARCAHAPDCSD